MTQDEVLKELHNVIARNQQFTTWTVSTPHLVELVNRAVLREREACALIAESMSLTDANMNKTWRTGCRDVAEAIRARGEA